MRSKTKVEKLIVFILLTSIIVLIVGVISLLTPEKKIIENTDNSNSATKAEHRYISSIYELRDGEIAMYDSDGRMYAAKIDEDSYNTTPNESNDSFDSQEFIDSEPTIPQYKAFVVQKLKELTDFDIDDFLSYEENDYEENGCSYASIYSLVKINSITPYSFCKFLAIVNKDNNSDFAIALLNDQDKELYKYDQLDRTKFTFDNDG